MGWKSCISCCGIRKSMEDNWEDIINQEEVEEVDEQYVFLEQFPTDRRVENPAVPFIGELPVPMDVGRVIDLQGEVHSNATRFSLNLACGNTLTADIAFHFNPRFDQNYIARNSRLSGHWGREESSSPQGNPFKRGGKFYITILAAENEFMVAVNGIHFCAYTYRVLRLRIQAIQINGDVTVDTLEYHMADKYPDILPHMRHPYVSLDPENSLPEALKDEVDLPLVCKLPSGIKIGQSMEIVGRTKLLPHSFYINLQNDVLLWPHPDVILHINPRFGNNATIINSWLNGNWSEEQSGPLLMSPGRPFLMKILLDSSYFRVTVDGVTVAEYPHRVSPHSIRALYIQGDVYIKHISIT